MAKRSGGCARQPMSIEAILYESTAKKKASRETRTMPFILHAATMLHSLEHTRPVRDVGTSLGCRDPLTRRKQKAKHRT